MTSLAAQQYRQNSVLTATPGELTLQLYNGLVKFIKLAIVHMEKGEIQATNDNLIKSQDILQELLCTLNTNYPIAKDMAALYEYMMERLIQANVKKDLSILEEVLEYAEQFRATWMQALKAMK
ncbi:flagellar export chaperone FliS [Aneurinibacillus aneurinilyticus]|jgi:flagellar protein FliS|uniref:Flagellar export chaperone FliS n=2 Tax=Aneurinibacillus aneurinilyticus TaxID=1391 RepID=A0A848CYS0_ANEAE|nr:flagellar export chaperone FliS [Aneurinibacillus aneurinilyticus]ERI09655.1 flagellar protein FliS [Aneurinibacillus aneurinilyticus ATCC 12856]MCI1693962.1 flagellar export chaperone FliS [Aneurinibacillus aneurinilyticus]MED0708261.1 flagellar export chaperone FliS [Aneurinibacillus aneurinilyticus]MED0724687.1 flagellar export chaperone FliS [Aneurinibacillus aneurinilyticus]MED0730558.1 flagellar export chaperone FliS [Aneurinibacillus aneurinilyticus]